MRPEPDAVDHQVLNGSVAGAIFCADGWLLLASGDRDRNRDGGADRGEFENAGFGDEPWWFGLARKRDRDEREQRHGAQKFFDQLVHRLARGSNIGPSDRGSTIRST